jgi:hypothetical protein
MRAQPTGSRTKLFHGIMISDIQVNNYNDFRTNFQMIYIATAFTEKSKQRNVCKSHAHSAKMKTEIHIHLYQADDYFFF